MKDAVTAAIGGDDGNSIVLVPWKVIPLFLDNDADSEIGWNQLPQYQQRQQQNPKNVIQLIDNNCRNNTNQNNSQYLIRMILINCGSERNPSICNDIKLSKSIQNVAKEDLWAIYAIISAIYFISHHVDDNNNDDDTNSSEYVNLLRKLKCSNKKNGTNKENGILKDDDNEGIYDSFRSLNVLLNLLWEQYISTLSSPQGNATSNKNSESMFLTKELWKEIVLFLYQRIYVVPIIDMHPLHDYSMNVVPLLSQDELRNACDILQFPNSLSVCSNSSDHETQHDNNEVNSGCNQAISINNMTVTTGNTLNNQNTISSLAVMKQIQDLCIAKNNNERLYAVFLEDDTTTNQQQTTFRHSCIPNSQLTLCSTKSVRKRGTMLISGEEDTTTAVIDNDDNEEKYLQLCVTSLFNSNNGSTNLANNNNENRNTYNAQSGDLTSTNWTICYIQDDDSAEQRETYFVRRTNESCGCLRCRFETLIGMMNDVHDPGVDVNHIQSILPTLINSIDDAISLGRYYFGKCNFLIAQTIYRYALLQFYNCNDSTGDQAEREATTAAAAADIIHALGAIELTQNNFLRAQKVWYDYSLKYPSVCQDHSGIQLQISKMNAYRYFATTTTESKKERFDHDDKSIGTIAREKTVGQTASTKHMIEFQSILPMVFITQNVVPTATCQQIIEWAESHGKWTQQRHYAVPTYDIPIHTVPLLLTWFMDQFWIPAIRQIVTNQFGCLSDEQLYIHDAFVVRYEAGTKSNHLPIHTDESTHSFVLSLNDDYDGGGTYFFDSRRTIHLRTGELLSFRGDSIQHGGEAVTCGVRYVVAAFLYLDSRELPDREPIAVHQEKSRVRKNHCAPQIINVDNVSRDSKQQKYDFSFGFRFDV